MIEQHQAAPDPQTDFKPRVHRTFSTAGQIRGLETRGSRNGASVGSAGKASRSRQLVVKIYINISSTERFTVTTNAQKRFTTFPEGEAASAPLAYAYGRPCVSLPVGCYRLHPPLPDSITQPKILTFYHRTESRRTSKPRHCITNIITQTKILHLLSSHRKQKDE